jgi:hypothetical protein
VATEKIIDNEHNAVHKKIKELLKIPFSFAKKNGKYVFRITEFRGRELCLPPNLIAENPREIFEFLQQRLQ